MLRLRFISGLSSGEEIDLKQYPVSFGREPTADVRLDAKGVWDSHACLKLELDGFFHLQSNPKALTLVNGERIENKRIKQGSEVQMGECRFQVLFSPVKQNAGSTSEWLVVIASGAAVVSQFILIYLLLSY